MKIRYFFVISFATILLFSGQISQAQSQDATIMYTDGLDVGDILVYQISIDEDFDDMDFLEGMDAEDGDRISYEVTEEFTDVTGTLDETFFVTLYFETNGEFEVSYPNGTVTTESGEFIVEPTTIELENGTVLEGFDAIALSSGAVFLGTASDDGDEVRIRIAFIVVVDYVYDKNTGILQSQTIEDSDGTGDIKMELTSSGSGFLNVDPIPLYLGITFSLLAVRVYHKRKAKI